METNVSTTTERVRTRLAGRSILYLTMVAIGLPFASGTLSAGGSGERRAKYVEYSYRDVTEPARVPALYRRFQDIALALCASLDAGLPMDLRRDVVCAERAIDRAVRSIDAPELTAYHTSRVESRSRVAEAWVAMTGPRG